MRKEMNIKKENAISSDTVYYTCPRCKKKCTARYSNFIRKLHDLCTPCTRRKTVTKMHADMTEKEKEIRNKNVSRKTKEAMSQIPEDIKKERYERMVGSMDWDERNKKWYKSFHIDKSKEEKKEIYKKISEVQLNKPEEEKLKIKNKKKATCLRNYGVEYPSYSEEIVQKQMAGRGDVWDIKEYNGLHYQTKPELKFIKHCLNNNIEIKDGPSIYYNFKNSRLYLTDFETDKYIVEIKSSHKWYYEDLESGKLEAKNEAAMKYAQSIGKQFLFLLDIKDYSQHI